MMKFKFSFVRISSNAKTGKISTTTSPEGTCPPYCIFKDNGCYAKNAPFVWHWNKVSNGERGMFWKDLMEAIKKYATYVWRHNVGGDLPTLKNGNISRVAIKQLVAANDRRRGFTYTHHTMTRKHNREVVRYANENGFTINVSADNFKQAASLRGQGFPVAVVGPIGFEGTHRIDGKLYVTCPAVNSDAITCESCKLCTMAKREAIIVFPAHGTRAKKVDAAISKFKTFELKLVA